MNQYLDYKDHIRQVPDFPKQGVTFYDIAPLIGDGSVFTKLIADMAEPIQNEATKIVAFDARGFIFGGAIASLLGIGCVMLRKPGKLSGETYTESYDLEYGSNSLQIQSDSLGSQDNVVLVDDVIATGGTALAGIELVQRCGARIREFCSLIDLPDLGGSKRITEAGVPVRTLVSYQGDV